MKIDRYKNILIIFIISIVLIMVELSCSSNRYSSRKVSIQLNDGWMFCQKGCSNWYRAVVPGCIHTDLSINGLIEDPFLATNEETVQWIETKDWIYQKSFTIPRRLLSMDNVRLYFKGLDTYAEVYLNDSLIITSDNMFREWSVDCKALLKKGENILKVIFSSPVKEDSIKASRLNYRLPDRRAFTRKAPYQYGWDWGPRFVTMGIWRPVVLRAWSCAVLDDFQIYQDRIRKDRADLSALFKITSADTFEAHILIINKDHSNVYSDSLVVLNPGINLIRMNFEIKNPELWWCNGLGTPYLYNITGEIRIDGSTVDEISRRIGIRNIEVVEKEDRIGTTFMIRLNGIPLFIKGANYIPQDSFLPSVTRSRYRRLIESVANANMNMLRVWGGGIYEDDYFYDLCDENGILVWQDFMFACTMYPGDSLFIENVRQEAIQNIKRLRNHPSIALWCGNNEVDEGWKNWGWQKRLGYTREDSIKVWNDYIKLFHQLLPSIVKEYDNGRYYLPSSPKIGWGHKESLTSGDCHYWGVWWGREPFSNYEKKVGRFMSEYGFQSIPNLETLKQFASQEDLYLGSEVMRSHQKHPFGYELIDTYMRRDYRVPESFKGYIYVSQLLQARGIRMAIEAHRRAKPYCMGTLYWQLNDCWPVVSWSSIDYYGRWKALHYTVKRAYQDILVSPVVENGFVKVFIISDRLKPFRGFLNMRLTTFSGKDLWRKRIGVNVPENSSNIYFEIKKKDLIKKNNERQLVFNSSILDGNKIIAENNLYFQPPKNLELTRVQIDRKVIEREGGYSIILCSKGLAKNVYLNVEGVSGFFTDNYFDLLPGESRRIEFLCDKKIKNFEDSLEIISLFDVY